MGVFERQLREETILNTAAKVFCARGFGITKMIHIAKEAKLSKGLIYFYFKSKDDLYMAVILHAIKRTIQFQKHEMEQHQDLNALDRLMRLLEKYFDFVHENPYYQDAISTFISMTNPLKNDNSQGKLTKGMLASPFYKQIMEQKFEPFILITKVLAQGKQDGSIKTNLPPIYLYLSIWSLMIGYEKLSINDPSDQLTSDNPFYFFSDTQWQNTIKSIVKTILTSP